MSAIVKPKGKHRAILSSSEEFILIAADQLASSVPMQVLDLMTGISRINRRVIC